MALASCADNSFGHLEPRSTDPIRIVLSGCGLVTQHYYVQALTRLEQEAIVEVVGIFDPDACAMAAVHGQLAAASLTSRFEDLLDFGADAAIIASPPCFHADQAVGALMAGLHIFCEKPLATTTHDADRILSAAHATGLRAGVGLVRRQFPATRSIKHLLKSGAIGRLRSVSCFEGGPFDWPVTSPSYFRQSEAGGGVLLDIGTHCLDLLVWWFGVPNSVSYADDAMGGIEANCLLLLQYDEFQAHIRLSRDWGQPNDYRFEGENGSISWMVNDPQSIEVDILTTKTLGTLSLREVAGGTPNFVDCFTAQIAAFLASLRTGTPLPAPASDGREVLALIEQCYARRRLMDMSWLSDEERLRAEKCNEPAR